MTNASFLTPRVTKDAFPAAPPHETAHDLTGEVVDLERALEMYQELDDQTNQAMVHRNIGIVLEHQGRLDEVLRHARLALDRYRAAGTGIGRRTSSPASGTPTPPPAMPAWHAGSGTRR
ncbi:MAG TPA: tetratricopeptide repeat protein [Actinophytocola sp.]|uniref:tetratricopeptide repeat protein n=1 Tax=Actinophytocola sp. TaxID=1872138 RepID=UPI002DFE43A8|nr:tetratricopeptide repeat protein [Actinophytocola sp.]